MLGKAGGLLTVAYMEFREDIAHVSLNGIDAYRQLLGDLLVRGPSGNQRQDILLPGS